MATHLPAIARAPITRRSSWLVGLSLYLAPLLSGGALAATYSGNPDDYPGLVKHLEPGDTLRLQPGRYGHGLPIQGLNGAPGRPIVIEGPAEGEPAVLLGHSGHNIISIKNTSYVSIRKIEIDGRGAFVDGVKCEGDARYAHHITLENLYIHNLARQQQSVGISTKCPAWDWVVRGNRIEGVGTGMYFGNSGGEDPFIGGLIEANEVINTIGYNLQIKHQKPRPQVEGMPTEPRRTIIRRNLFVKAEGGSEGPEARPNVLVGHLPLEGPGKDDEYVIYANRFFQNPNEALFQGEGNIALYNNLFFNSHRNEFPAIAIQPHNDIPRRVRVFFNTVVDPWKGIRVLRKEENWVDDQVIIGNAVFAGVPIEGGQQADNMTADYAQVAEFLQNPVADLHAVDLRPRPGLLEGERIELGQFAGYPDHERDFEGSARSAIRRGAYAATPSRSQRGKTLSGLQSTADPPPSGARSTGSQSVH